MSEWWTYSLRDFLLFSPATYQRLVERTNGEAWPAQWIGALACLAILLMLALRVPRARRIIAFVLAFAWASVAWDFLWQRYATINWAATYMAAAFGVQAVILVAFGAAARSDAEGAPPSGRRLASAVGFAMLLAAFAYPGISLSTGRALTATEWFGVMPDPTVLATIGALVLMPGRLRGWAMPIPVAWCAVAGATSWLLDWPAWWLLPAAGVAGLAALAADLRRPGGASAL